MRIRRESALFLEDCVGVGKYKAHAHDPFRLTYIQTLVIFSCSANVLSFSNRGLSLIPILIGMFVIRSVSWWCYSSLSVSPFGARVALLEFILGSVRAWRWRITWKEKSNKTMCRVRRANIKLACLIYFIMPISWFLPSPSHYRCLSRACSLGRLNDDCRLHIRLLCLPAAVLFERVFLSNEIIQSYLDLYTWKGVLLYYIVGAKWQKTPHGDSASARRAVLTAIMPKCRPIEIIFSSARNLILCTCSSQS